MKIITVCSNSHNKLLDQHFLPSIPSSLSLTIEKIEQKGSGDHGWNEDFIATMRKKLEIVLHYAKTETKKFIYSDTDIRFNLKLDPIQTLLNIFDEKIDLACQRDGNNICAGFMVINPSKKNIDYLQATLDYMKIHPQKCDQLAFKELYSSNFFADVPRPQITLLDITTGFGNFSHLQSGILWTPENNVMEKNKNIIKKQFLWHANHTLGVDNKIKMLNVFKNICKNN